MSTLNVYISVIVRPIQKYTVCIYIYIYRWVYVCVCVCYNYIYIDIRIYIYIHTHVLQSRTQPYSRNYESILIIHQPFIFVSTIFINILNHNPWAFYNLGLSPFLLDQSLPLKSSESSSSSSLDCFCFCSESSGNHSACPTPFTNTMEGFLFFLGTTRNSLCGRWHLLKGKLSSGVVGWIVSRLHGSGLSVFSKATQPAAFAPRCGFEPIRALASISLLILTICGVPSSASTWILQARSKVQTIHMTSKEADMVATTSIPALVAWPNGWSEASSAWKGRRDRVVAAVRFLVNFQVHPFLQAVQFFFVEGAPAAWRDMTDMPHDI